MATCYVASVRTPPIGADSRVNAVRVMSSLPDNVANWGGYRPKACYDSIWQIDGALGDAEAIASALSYAAYADRGWAQPELKVTRIYPPEPTADERLDAARNVLRADYWDDVRGVVTDIRDLIAARDVEDEDAVSERLDELVDGHQRVIYTAQAIEGLLYTDNESAYVDDFGEPPSPAAFEDNSAWSQLMYCAFRADILSTLGDIAALIEAAAPDYCEDCGAELPADGESDKCDDCAALPKCSKCGADLTPDNEEGDICESCQEGSE